MSHFAHTFIILLTIFCTFLRKKKDQFARIAMLREICIKLMVYIEKKI